MYMPSCIYIYLSSIQTSSDLGLSAPSPQQQALAIANFKRRTEWQQEILKAHNVVRSSHCCYYKHMKYNESFYRLRASLLPLGITQLSREGNSGHQIDFTLDQTLEGGKSNHCQKITGDRPLNKI